MAVDIKFLLARHSLLFLGRECGVKCLNSGGVIATVGSGGGDIHPLSAVKLLYHKIITDSIT